MVVNRILSLVFALVTLFNFSASAIVVEGEIDNGSEMSAFILHHVVDDHEWHFYGEGESAIHLALPIILVDNGLQVFSSDRFSVVKIDTLHGHHGEASVEKYAQTEDGKYALFHGKIYKTDNGVLNFDEHGHPTNTHPLDFSITKNVAVLFLATIIMILIFFSVGKAYKTRGVNSAPKGLQSFMEPLILFVRNDVAIPNIGEKKYAKFMPYLLTAFFFIWIINLLGLIPFLGGVNLTGNISFTVVLALITYFITQFSGNKDYWKHILLPPVPKALYPIMIPVEIIGTLTKPFALMIRLFANITAGHIVVLAFIGIIFLNKSAGWSALSIPMGLFISALELLVAFLQAYIFTMLSALFIGTAVEEHDHHDDHH